jgi:hypothetical protein
MQENSLLLVNVFKNSAVKQMSNRTKNVSSIATRHSKLLTMVLSLTAEQVCNTMVYFNNSTCRFSLPLATSKRI